jgi:hypothetical protein
MDSHKIWIANLNDLLTNHVCQGLLKTYAEILRLCGGHKLKLSIQTAMEGISHLSSHKINSDYKVLLESLNRIGYTDTNLNDIITNAYSSYALSAIRSAGIKCDRLDASLLNGPKQGAFIHEVYINVARNLWTRPDVLIDQNVPQLKIYVKESIEQGIRSGVNLNYITAALAAGTANPVPPSVNQTVSLTIKERLNTLNGSKSILDDDDSDDVVSEEGETANIQATIKPMPAAPSMFGEMTIENDDLAPDNMTITDSSLQVNASLPPMSIKSGSKKEDEMIINVTHHRDMPFDIDNTSSYTVQDDEDEDDEDEDDEDNEDNEDEDNVTLSSKPSVLSSQSKSQSSSLKSKSKSNNKEVVDMLRDDDSIPSYLVAGAITLPDTLRSGQKQDVDTNSTYSVTLLSHRDMLSSRLSKLGF